MQSNKIVLIIASVTFLLATLLAFVYIKSAASALESQNQPEKTVDVLFVINDLPANHPIDPEVDLRKESVGESTSPGLARGAVRFEEKDSLAGLRTNAALLSGVPLMYGNLARIRDMNLGGSNNRAMSISVTATDTFGGLLVPSDRVDIIVSYKVPAPPSEVPAMPTPMSNDPAAIPSMIMQAMMQQQQGGMPDEWVAEPVLENIRVIAVGSQLGGSRQQITNTSTLGSSNLVTIEVTKEQAYKLIQFIGGGNKLTLLLRPSARARAADAGNVLSDESTTSDE